MAYSKTLLASAAIALSLAAPVVAQDAETPAEVTADTVVATVGGTDITIGHMIIMLEALSDQNKSLPDYVIFEGLLERLIQQRAVGGSVTEPNRAAELAIENEESAILASTKVTEIAEAIEISDEDLEAAYASKYADFEPVKEFNASHILVATQEEAAALVEELNGGADFAELAKENSTGPTGPNGGNLGWFGAGMMVPEFEEAVMALEVGDVSEPVQTQFGWHVITLNETRLPEAPALDEVRDTIQAELWETRLREEIEELVEAAEIERPDLSGIDPAVLKDTTLVTE